MNTERGRGETTIVKHKTRHSAAILASDVAATLGTPGDRGRPALLTVLLAMLRPHLRRRIRNVTVRADFGNVIRWLWRFPSRPAWRTCSIGALSDSFDEPSEHRDRPGESVQKVSLTLG